MARSYRKGIYKDKGGKNIYWKIIRRKIKQIVKDMINDPDKEIPQPKEIVNDYNYSDYTIDYEFDRSSGYFWYNGDHDHNWTLKFRRK